MLHYAIKYGYVSNESNFVKMSCKIFSVVLILLSNLCYPQTSDNQINQYLKKFENYLYSNSDSSFYYVNRSYRKSVDLKDNKLIAECLAQLGRYYFINEEYSKSENILQNAEKYAINTNSDKTLSTIYNFKGLIKHIKGENSEALVYYHKAFDLAEKTEFYENQTKILLNLSGLYLIQKDTLRCLENLEKCINISSDKKVLNSLTKALMNSAILYTVKNPEEAKRLYNLALVQAKADNNLKTQLEIHINLSNLYLNDNQFEFVLEHLIKAEKIQKIINNDSESFYIFYNYGAYYFEKNNFRKAVDFYLKSLQIADSNYIPPDRINSIYNSLSVAYEHLNQYKEANIYYKKQQKLSDSIFTLEQNKLFNDLQTKYEVDKKNLKINLLKKDNQLVRNRKNLILVVSVLTFITLIIFAQMLRNKIKIEKIRNIEKQILHDNEIALLNKEQEIKQIKAKYDGQNNERVRLSKEIHDGVGATLAGLRLQLSQTNDELKNSKIEYITHQLGSVFKELRAISHNLSLNYIEEKSLYELLVDLAEKYRNNSFIVHVMIFPEDALSGIDNFQKINLYRIFQELLFNTEKYAKAKNVVISITNHDSYLNIIFEDDGIGFDNKKITKGIGINNIKERISLLKGNIIFETQINKGTTVLINIPYLK